MRFAWIRSTKTPDSDRSPTPADRAILVAYNAVWWAPAFLTVVGLVSYTTGLLGFLAITVIRAAVNLYRNNVMPVEKAMFFPLRLP